jgi:hypothetical protein
MFYDPQLVEPVIAEISDIDNYIEFCADFPHIPVHSQHPELASTQQSALKWDVHE